eukprot:Plantae.Rhodophyta-Hildenbrandia_rubra.ctg1239.p1 GENE.Plantae.Rhodophyta-Hildenbrandia_rubra.ctg1239~~Plantae.Rhodophyta-Hildenbrandia_rubra.ctg1239.p1  ORF type:complete len:459 (+),score=93.33 Plantae.Rhodophyta-Hildenbrandia_rubra.ctg1239:290-1666(+)
MEELSRRLKKIDWKDIQRQATNVRRSTASALKDLVMTDLENKVRAATADTAWGASASDLGMIAQATYNREDYTLIMGILWQRLGSSRWRCVLKGLDLLKHLICFGAHRVRDEAQAALYHLRSLQNYRFVDKMTGRDHGAAVREKATLVCELLADEGLLEDYKRENSELRNKVSKSGAISSEDYRYGNGGGASNSLGMGRPSNYEEDGYGGYEGGYQSGGSGGGLVRKPYDDVPGGSKYQEGGFGGFDDGGENSGTVSSKNVDDLLGGSEPVLALESAEAVEQHKQTNGESNNEESAAGNDDLNDILAGIPDGPATTTTSVPSSRLYETLKIDKKDDQSGFGDLMAGSSNSPGAAGETGNGVTEDMKNVNGSVDKSATESTAYGGLVHFDNIMLGKGDRVEPKRMVNRPSGSAEQAGNPFLSTPPPPMTKRSPKTAIKSNPKEDPFADLLTNAKKTGVL